MINRIARWFDSRLGLAVFARRGLNHIFPDHWSFMLGEIALYSFIMLVLTGVFLATFFNGSSTREVYHGSYEALQGVTMSAAYRSVLDISFDVRAGLFMRQTHHWAALVFIGAIMVHIFRIFFTGAFRRPREVNWVIGLTLLILAMASGFAGYSIPDDLLSGTGLRIVYAGVLSIPLIGSWLAFIIFGGRVPATITIARLYALHIVVLPALIAAFAGLHIAVIWRQLHTNYPGPGRTDRTIVGSRLWPTYAARGIGLFFLVFGVLAALGGIMQINPIWIYGPFEPVATLPGSQPDWYLGWLEGALRIFPGVNLRIGGFLVPNVFFPGVLLPTAIFAVLYLYPFLEKRITGDREEHHVLQHPSDHPWRTTLGCTVFVFLFVLFFAGGQDVFAVVSGVPLAEVRTALRVSVFAAPAATAVIAFFVFRSLRKRRQQHLG